MHTRGETPCCIRKAVGALEGGKSEYVNAVYGQLKIIFERMMQPWLWPGALFGLTPSGRQSARQLLVLHSHTAAMVSRYASPTPWHTSVSPCVQAEERPASSA